MPNHRITETKGEVCLDPESYCPMNTMNYKLSVLICGDISCRWSQEWADRGKKELVQRIMDDLQSKVEAFVDKNNPYDIHKQDRGNKWLDE
jgi:hypothetical protein